MREKPPEYIVVADILPRQPYHGIKYNFYQQILFFFPLVILQEENPEFQMGF